MYVIYVKKPCIANSHTQHEKIAQKAGSFVRMFEFAQLSLISIEHRLICPQNIMRSLYSRHDTRIVTRCDFVHSETHVWLGFDYSSTMTIVNITPNLRIMIRMRITNILCESSRTRTTNPSKPQKDSRIRRIYSNYESSNINTIRGGENRVFLNVRFLKKLGCLPLRRCVSLRFHLLCARPFRELTGTKKRLPLFMRRCHLKLKARRRGVESECRRKLCMKGTSLPRTMLPTLSTVYFR